MAPASPQTQPQQLAVSYDALGVGARRTHAAQFYEDDAFLLASVGDFLASGLAVGQDVVAVVTPAHRDGLRAHLDARGFDIERAMVRGQLALIDAHELLAAFMIGSSPDPARFHVALDGLLRDRGMSLHQPTVRIFGEMVDVLCRAGNVAGALALESLWNDLGRTHRFSLLCGYCMESFRDGAHTASVASICDSHAHVIPTERYTMVDAGGREREIALLQQRALALSSEVERRAALELALRDALARAEAASRAKSEFLAVMSHELRTPLNAIGGHVQLMEMGLHGPVTERQRDALARVQRSQRHLLALINDVLNLARSDAAPPQYELDDIALEPLLSEVSAQLGPLFAAVSLTCDVRPTDGSARLAARADREKVHQILLNLLGNALKFTPPGGFVRLHAGPSRSSADCIDVEVQDSGVGIPADKLESIFEPFVQLATRTAGSRDGIGLGLSISRMLARGMGGELSASSALGAGSTLTLTLPRA